MPTKYNRAGKMQPYVPAGNKDGGEYRGDGFGGENYTPIRAKPQGSEIEKPDIETTPKLEQKEEIKSTKSFIDDIAKDTNLYVLGEEIQNKLQDSLEGSNETALNATIKQLNNQKNKNELFKKVEGTSYYREIDNQVGISENSIDKAFSKQGMTFFHEVGHLINHKNKQQEQKKNWFGTYRDEVILTESKDLFEDGKSLRETIQEEIGEFSAKKIPQEIRKEQNKFYKEYFKNTNYDEKLKKESNEFVKQFHEEHGLERLKKTIRDSINSGEIPVSTGQARLDYIFENWENQYPEYKKQSAIRKEQNKLFAEAQNKWFKETGMECVSDMWSSKADMGFGIGHTRQYYAKGSGYYASLKQAETLLGDEFFATMWGARVLNYTECIESTKKYLPKSYAKFEKLAKLIEEKQYE